MPCGWRGTTRWNFAGPACARARTASSSPGVAAVWCATTRTWAGSAMDSPPADALCGYPHEYSTGTAVEQDSSAGQRPGQPPRPHVGDRLNRDLRVDARGGREGRAVEHVQVTHVPRLATRIAGRGRGR